MTDGVFFSVYCKILRIISVLLVVIKVQFKQAATLRKLMVFCPKFSHPLLSNINFDLYKCRCECLLFWLTRQMHMALILENLSNVTMRHFEKEKYFVYVFLLSIFFVKNLSVYSLNLLRPCFINFLIYGAKLWIVFTDVFKKANCHTALRKHKSN